MCSNAPPTGVRQVSKCNISRATGYFRHLYGYVCVPVLTYVQLIHVQLNTYVRVTCGMHVHVLAGTEPVYLHVYTCTISLILLL